MGQSMVSLVNSHRNATRIGWHLKEIDLRVAPGLPPGLLGVWGCLRELPPLKVCFAEHLQDLNLC